MAKVPNTEPVQVNVTSWIKDNEKFFLPPVCNKMMHNEGQMKVMYVGGPNQRKDYHIEEGEELFYMAKGDMCLKVVANNKHRDIVIKEGEIFLLPARVAHSPNRVADTVGLVIERDRLKSETDGLRYYVEEDGVPTLQSLYEKWFYCEDLGVQLGPVIKGFFASEQYKTGKPLPGTIPENPPVTLDAERVVEDPFSLAQWLEANRSQIDAKGYKLLFEGDYQFTIMIYGKGERSDECPNAESFIWQLEGSSKVTVGDSLHELGVQDTLLVPLGKRFTVAQNAGSLALVCYQDHARKPQAQQQESS